MKIIHGLFLVLFLTACESSLIADLVTQPGHPFYYDGFSDHSSGWIESVSANGIMGYANDAYRIQVQTAGYDLVALSRQAYKDVRVEADAIRLAGPLINRFGLVCRFQDIDNFYVFFISSDGYYAIGKIKKGAISLLGQEMMAYSSSIAHDSGLNHLRFDCIGETLTAYVNGQPVAITSDADFSGGDAGLIAGAFDVSGVDVSFDNFVVYKP